MGLFFSLHSSSIGYIKVKIFIFLLSLYPIRLFTHICDTVYCKINYFGMNINQNIENFFKFFNYTMKQQHINKTMEQLNHRSIYICYICIHNAFVYNFLSIALRFKIRLVGPYSLSAERTISTSYRFVHYEWSWVRSSQENENRIVYFSYVCQLFLFGSFVDCVHWLLRTESTCCNVNNAKYIFRNWRMGKLRLGLFK